MRLHATGPLIAPGNGLWARRRAAVRRVHGKQQQNVKRQIPLRRDTRGEGVQPSRGVGAWRFAGN